MRKAYILKQKDGKKLQFNTFLSAKRYIVENLENYELLAFCDLDNKKILERWKKEFFEND